MDVIETKSLPDWGPFQIEARLMVDHDTTPNDFDVYTPKQIEAWRTGEWSYVGLKVVVIFEDREIGSAAVWGFEHGWIPLTDEDDNLTEDPVQFYSVLDDAGPGSTLDDVANEATFDAGETIRRLQSIEVPSCCASH
jgi:hypothetical protein